MGTDLTFAASSPLGRAIALVLQELRAEPDMTRAEDVVTALVDSIAPGDFGAVAAVLNGNAETGEGRVLHSCLMRRWTSHDPRGAAEWVAGMRAGLAREEAIEDLSSTWARLNLPEAVAWAERHPVPEERERALTSMAYATARIAPVTALGLAEKIDQGHAREDLVVHAAMQWATAAPAEAAAWSVRLSDPFLRERTVAAVATMWADSEPRRAAEFALEALAPGRPRDDAVIGIVQRWVQCEPAAATAWVGRFAAGPLRRTAVDILATQSP